MKRDPRKNPVNREVGKPGHPTQFAEKENSEPEVGLQMTEADGKYLMEQVAIHTRKFQRRYHLDPQTAEDVAQDTIVDLLAQAKKRGASALDPRLINVATAAVAQRALRPGQHHTELTARNILWTAVRLAEEEKGEKLTPKELEALADDIRLNAFAPRRRPPADYWKDKTAVSLDAPLNNDTDDTFGDALADPELDTPFNHDQSELANLVERLSKESKDRVTPAQIRKEAWNHLAELVEAEDEREKRLRRNEHDTDTIRITPGWLAQRRPADTKEAADKVRESVAASGGAAKLAAAWQKGDTTEAQESALFAPFGDINNLARARAAELLLRNPHMADELWETALGIAIRPVKPAAG